jgi:hypothetical protein
LPPVSFSLPFLGALFLWSLAGFHQLHTLLVWGSHQLFMVIHGWVSSKDALEGVKVKWILSLKPAFWPYEIGPLGFNLWLP